MKCLHIVSGDLWAGAEVSAYNLMVALASRPGVEVRALVLNEGTLESRLRSASVPVLVIPEATTGVASLVRAAMSSAQGFRPDVIHTHRYKENVLGCTLAAATGARHVRTAHGLPPELEWNGRLKGLGALFDRSMATWAGSTWIAVSDDLAGRIPSIHGEVHVVPNGLPRRAATPDRETLDLAFEDGAPAWYVGFAGRLEHVKRPDRFLRILSHLPDEVAGRKVRGVLIGEGALRREMEELVTSLGLGARVRLLGHRTNGENLVAALDVLLIPSDHEGNPMVLLEAMRAGVPVVASAVGGIPEALGEAEWVVPPEEEDAMARAVLQFLEDPDLRAAVSTELRDRFERKFTIEIAANRILEIYGAA